MELIEGGYKIGLKYAGKSLETGALKIISNVDLSKPSLTLTEVDQQILYSDPLLDDQAFYPLSSLNKNVSDIYESVVNVDGTDYFGIFKENPVLGQMQYWRISFSFSGKLQNNALGVGIFIRNPINGFQRRLLTTLPESVTDGDNLTVDVATYADQNSLKNPLGNGTGGYQIFMAIRGNDNIDITIDDVARMTC